MRNDNWAGDANGETWPDRAERIVFRIFADPDTSYNALEAGETDIANIPPARSAEAQSNWGTTVDTAVARLVPLHHQPCAIRASVARRTCCCARRSRWRSTATRSTSRSTTAYAASRQASRLRASPGSPRTCATTAPTTPRQRRPPMTSGWLPATSRRRSRSSSTPMPVMNRWWRSSSTTWRRSASRPRPTRGSRRRISPSSPTERVWSAALGGSPTTRRTTTSCTTCSTPIRSAFNNYAGVSIPEFDALVDEAKQTVDPDAQAELFQQAEDVLLNQEVAVIPINWYLGDYAYNPETLAGVRARVRLPHQVGAGHRQQVSH